jgi:hypothetical protein
VAVAREEEEELGVGMRWRSARRDAEGGVVKRTTARRGAKRPFVFAHALSELDEFSSEVLLGGEGTMGVTAQREIVCACSAVSRHRRKCGTLSD